MRKWKLTGAIVVAIAIIIQLIPSGRPGTNTINKNDLIANNQISDSVSRLFKNSCYDCHSNETTYPWYSYVAPVSWLISRDVKHGRKHLNFSEWESYSKLDKAKHLDDISDEVNGKEMPLPSYLIMHPNSKLTDEERDLLVNWTDEFSDSLFE